MYLDVDIRLLYIVPITMGQCLKHHSVLPRLAVVFNHLADQREDRLFTVPVYFAKITVLAAPTVPLCFRHLCLRHPRLSVTELAPSGLT